MRKYFKIACLIAVILAIAVFLTGCSNKNESKTYKFYESIINNDEYLIKIEGDIEVEEGQRENGTVTIAKKGDNMFVSTHTVSSSASVINKEDTTYILLDSEKLYVTTQRDRNEEDNNIFFEKEDIEKLKEQTYVNGKEEIDGVEYEYEEYDTEDGGKIKYCFEGNTLKYVKEILNEQEDTSKILEATNNVSDSIFEVPSDYTEANF